MCVISPPIPIFPKTHRLPFSHPLYRSACFSFTPANPSLPPHFSLFQLHRNIKDGGQQADFWFRSFFGCAIHHQKSIKRGKRYFLQFLFTMTHTIERCRLPLIRFSPPPPLFDISIRVESASFPLHLLLRRNNATRTQVTFLFYKLEVQLFVFFFGLILFVDQFYNCKGRRIWMG